MRSLIRADISRHKLKLAQTTTMSATRRDSSAAMSSGSQGDRDVVRGESPGISERKHIAGHQQRVAQ